MREKLVKVLEAEGKRIVALASEDMEAEKQGAIRTMEAKINGMVESLKTQPPKGAAEVIEILEKGGLITSKKVNVEEYTLLDLVLNNQSLIRDVNPSGRLKKGKYKITLIVEPMEAQP